MRIVVCATAAFTLAGAVALPCVCPESEGLENHFRDAEAVVAGRVVALETVRTDTPNGATENMVATLEVVRRWKGPSANVVRVLTCGTQVTICTCGASFELGGHYIVFAAGDPLATGLCSGTTAYSAVAGAEDLQWVGAEELVHALDDLVARLESSHAR